MFITPAYAQAATGPGAGTSTLFLVGQFVLIGVIFYFLLIRPQQRRLKEHRALIGSVKRGDQVVTGGGFLGKVTRVTDDEVEVELGPNVRVRAVKSTITDVRRPGAPVAANDAKA